MSVAWGSMETSNTMMNFLKAILAASAILLGIQVGRDLAHKTMASTSGTPAAQ